jgi:hypothetical protein
VNAAASRVNTLARRVNTIGGLENGPGKLGERKGEGRGLLRLNSMAPHPSPAPHPVVGRPVGQDAERERDDRRRFTQWIFRVREERTRRAVTG